LRTRDRVPAPPVPLKCLPDPEETARAQHIANGVKNGIRPSTDGDVEHLLRRSPNVWKRYQESAAVVQRAFERARRVQLATLNCLTRSRQTLAAAQELNTRTLAATREVLLLQRETSGGGAMDLTSRSSP